MEVAARDHAYFGDIKQWPRLKLKGKGDSFSFGKAGHVILEGRRVFMDVPDRYLESSVPRALLSLAAARACRRGQRLLILEDNLCSRLATAEL